MEDGIERSIINYQENNKETKYIYIFSQSNGNYIIFGNTIDSATDNGMLIDETNAIVANNEIKNSDLPSLIDE